jgi:hypothetical protein
LPERVRARAQGCIRVLCCRCGQVAGRCAG